MLRCILLRTIDYALAPYSKQMPSREDIEFKTVDGVTLRGWFYPAANSQKAPCIVLAHGWSATKEFDLDNFAETFQGAGFAALVYDHR